MQRRTQGEGRSHAVMCVRGQGGAGDNCGPLSRPAGMAPTGPSGHQHTGPGGPSVRSRWASSRATGLSLPHPRKPPGASAACSRRLCPRHFAFEHFEGMPSAWTGGAVCKLADGLWEVGATGPLLKPLLWGSGRLAVFHCPVFSWPRSEPGPDAASQARPSPCQGEVSPEVKNSPKTVFLWTKLLLRNNNSNKILKTLVQSARVLATSRSTL